MKTWVIKIGTSILRGTEETSTEEVIENPVSYTHLTLPTTLVV